MCVRSRGVQLSHGLDSEMARVPQSHPLWPCQGGRYRPRKINEIGRDAELQPQHGALYQVVNGMIGFEFPHNGAEEAEDPRPVVQATQAGISSP